MMLAIGLYSIDFKFLSQSNFVVVVNVEQKMTITARIIHLDRLSNKKVIFKWCYLLRELIIAELIFVDSMSSGDFVEFIFADMK